MRKGADQRWVKLVRRSVQQYALFQHEGATGFAPVSLLTCSILLRLLCSYMLGHALDV